MGFVPPAWNLPTKACQSGLDGVAVQDLRSLFTHAMVGVLIEEAGADFNISLMRNAVGEKQD
jgi:hypothetical protein